MIDHGRGRYEFITVDNTPTNYVEPCSDANDCKRHPGLLHCKRQTVPIIWMLHINNAWLQLERGHGLRHAGRQGITLSSWGKC